ncbi:MAG TPA: hypothetical protein VFX49_16145 [Chloroflexota bacterium]|nr:hypothetical protein [Chloroflexota bacterium]
MLRRVVTRGVVRHTLVHGQGAQLIFLWVLGAGALTLVWPEPALAVAWTILAGTLGVLIVRDQLRRTAPHRLVLRSYAARRVRTDGIGDDTLREAVEASVCLFAEIAVKAIEISVVPGMEPSLDQALADADELVALQAQAVLQAQELARVMRVIERSGTAHFKGREHAAGARATGDDARDAVEREVDGARELVGQVGRQLQELLLRVAQLERRAGDVVQSAYVTQRAGETLTRLRRVVSARREAAEEAIREWVRDQPDRQPTRSTLTT